jgi:hypothetical protein
LLSRVMPSLRVPLLYLLVGIILFHDLLLNGMILIRGDVYSYFYPLWNARSAALLRGELPWWSPDLFMGTPLLANSQVGTFYPLNVLLTPLPVPSAYSLSLLLHFTGAMCGVYLFARRGLHLTRPAAFLSGLIFGLGGYLGAQVEHINQVQALAWMPWLFLLLHELRTRLMANRFRAALHPLLLMAVVLALQLFAGHPQSVFITLVGLGIFTLVERPFRPRLILHTALGLTVAIGIAALLASPQIIPTAELQMQSQRGGGLSPQGALAFSLDPWLIGRGFLPSYDSLLFQEYIVYVGMIALGLAVIGAGIKPLSRLSLILLVGVAFLLALGAYNPLNWGLAALPGFSFFRVPARWLVLLSFGMALLAGCGLDALHQRIPRGLIGTALGVMLALMTASLVSDRAAEQITGPALPTLRTWMGWGIAAGVWLLLVMLAGRTWRYQHRLPILVLTAVTVELLLASGTLTFNHGAPADTYSASRFTIRQLQALNEGQTPPGRFLSITPLEFDPGDVARLTERYQQQGLSELAIRTALVATKMRESLAPNLALVWGLPGVDGFDGGLLPTAAYAEFTRVLTPDGEPVSDGRLREVLALPTCRGACIPEQRWLNLMHTRYLITDKTGDVVQDGIFYDTSLSTTLPAVVETPVPFQATAIDVLITCAEPCPAYSLQAEVSVSNAGDTVLLRTSENVTVESFLRVRMALPQPLTPTQISLSGQGIIHAVTLVDTRTGAFQQLTLPPWRRVLSSDIKLYENQAVLPRAFVVPRARVTSDEVTLLNWLQDPAFDPAQEVILNGGAEIPLLPGTTDARLVTITEYTAAQITLTVAAGSTPSYLILTDADYPGWVAEVNGLPAPIQRANGLFRAVRLGPEPSTVVFRYAPGWWPGIGIFALVTWLGVGVMMLALGWRNPGDLSE